MHFSNYEIKLSRQGDELEVLLKKITEVNESSKNVEVDDISDAYVHYPESTPKPEGIPEC